MSIYFFDLLDDTLGFFHLSIPSALIVKRFLTVLFFKGTFTSNIKFAFTKAVSFYEYCREKPFYLLE